MSAGCNRLIQKGANVYLGVEEFLDYLVPKKKSKKAREEQISLFGDTEEEKQILKLIAEGVRDGDEIMEKLDMPVQIYNQTVTMLEIKGAITSLGANHWTLS